MVRVPCHQVGLLAAIERVRGELMLELRREPLTEEIAASMKTTPATVRAPAMLAGNQSAWTKKSAAMTSMHCKIRCAIRTRRIQARLPTSTC